MKKQTDNYQFPIVRLYTDGSCTMQNAGGWCSIIKYKEYNRILSGNAQNTSSDEMELVACVEGIKKIYSHFKEPVIINLISDSEQALMICENFFCNQRRKASQQKFQKYAQQLQQFPFLHYLKTDWVKGHSGVPINELCDIISREESKFRQEQYTIKIQSKFHQETNRGFWSAWINDEERITLGGYTEAVPNFCVSLYALNLILKEFRFSTDKLIIQLDSPNLVNSLNCAIKSDFENLNLRKTQQEFEPYFRITEKLITKFDVKLKHREKVK